jgi:hypothetical protein
MERLMATPSGDIDKQKAKEIADELNDAIKAQKIRASDNEVKLTDEVRKTLSSVMKKVQQYFEAYTLDFNLEEILAEGQPHKLSSEKFLLLLENEFRKQAGGTLRAEAPPPMTATATPLLSTPPRTLSFPERDITTVQALLLQGLKNITPLGETPQGRLAPAELRSETRAVVLNERTHNILKEQMRERVALLKGEEKTRIEESLTKPDNDPQLRELLLNVAFDNMEQEAKPLGAQSAPQAIYNALLEGADPTRIRLIAEVSSAGKSGGIQDKKNIQEKFQEAWDFLQEINATYELARRMILPDIQAKMKEIKERYEEVVHNNGDVKKLKNKEMRILKHALINKRLYFRK